MVSVTYVVEQLTSLISYCWFVSHTQNNTYCTVKVSRNTATFNQMALTKCNSSFNALSQQLNSLLIINSYFGSPIFS